MRRQEKISLTILTFGAFWSLLCSTLMNIALPILMRTFHVTAEQVQWVSNGYMLINALMIPVSAYLIKRFSFRRLFLGFTSVFLVGTILGSMAPSFWLVVFARMIQAVGAGVMVPLVNVMAIRYAPKGKQGSVMGFIGLAFNFSPIIGPTLSGVILTYFSWRYLFILLIPFLAGVLVVAFKVLPAESHSLALSFDYQGLVLISLGLWFLLWALSNVSQLLSGEGLLISLSLVAAIVFWLLFVWLQLRTRQPLVNLNVFKTRQFTFALVINSLTIATMYGNTILLPLLVQNSMHKSPLVSGLVILPGALITGFMSSTSGKFYDRFKIKHLVLIGLTIDLCGTLLQMLIGARSSIWMVTLGQAVRQSGLVLMLIPLQTHSLVYLKRAQLPDGVAIFNTLRQVAATMGTALIVAAITITDAHLHVPNSRVGIQVGFGICLCLLLVAVTQAFRLQNAKGIPDNG